MFLIDLDQHVILDRSVFFLIWIRVLKVRIRPFINLSDLNYGYDKVLEEPDQKRPCSE